MNDERLYKIGLNAIPFIGPVNYGRLVAAFGSAKGVFAAGKEDLVRVEKVGEKLAAKIKNANPLPTAEKELLLAEKIGAKIFLAGDEGYPAPLLNIYSPPPVLYIKGQWRTEDELSIAVVGTRNPTVYGKTQAGKFGNELAKRGVTVVSGLARGVDGEAHREAIRAGGRTVAALGCGLNVYYPSEHRALQLKIAEHGAVISQFPVSMGPDKIFFPMRNRILSGLTLGTLVIEAAERSGALITSAAALEENREVFALPGPVTSKKSDGANRLIKRGHARLVSCVDDIVSELPEYIQNKLVEKQAVLPFSDEETLTDDEKSVMAQIDHEVKHIDKLSRDSGLPSNSVSAILLALELKGKVKQLAGKLFLKIR